MKTVLITGGTDGIGKSLVKCHLNNGNMVVAVGNSFDKGERLRKEAEEMGKAENLIFLQADLSLIQENKKVVSFVQNKFSHLDLLILCAASLRPQESSYQETKEGFEFTFALYYLSRYYLSYHLIPLMNQAEDPMIVNVAAPGMKGEVNVNDLQFKNNYNGQKVQFHGSRLNDLLGVSFSRKNETSKIKYMLFNPMAARTNGAKQMFDNNIVMRLLVRVYYKFKGKEPDEIVNIISKQVDSVSKKGLSAFVLEKEVDLSMKTFDEKNAMLLEQKTKEMLAKYL